MEDLKIDLGYVLVRGKGDKERIVPLGRSALDALASYMGPPRNVLAGEKSSPLVFLGRGGRKLTRQRVWQMLKSASGAAGANATPHMLRHSCATHMVKMALIFARCRQSSGTRTSRLRRSIRILLLMV
jgi:integrase/recombinase XerD